MDWEKVKAIEENLGFSLTEEQKNTLVAVVENKTNHLIIGKPGVGKSVLIDVLKQYLGDKLVVGSTTGVSNQRLFNGRGGSGSMHRIFSLPIKMFNDSHKKKVSSFTTKMLASNHQLEYILIDEAGFLLNADLLELIYHRIQRFNRRHRDRPRRDIKLILVGDLAQIPPFFKEEEDYYMQEHYGSPYFFKSERFESMGFDVHALSQVNRTKDKTFLACLDALRFGEEHRYQNLCKWVNSVMYKHPPSQDLPVMTCWNQEADRVNLRNLEANPNEEFIYYSQVEGDFDTKNCPSGEFVKVKVGAKLMTLINDNEDGMYSNGSLGVCTMTQSDGVWVKFDHQPIETFVPLHMFEQEEPEVVGEKTNEKGEKVPNIEYKVTGTCLALPVALAYGLSVHKNQGSTVSSPCIVDLGRKGFKHNNSNFGESLAYVALSRFSRPEDIYLKYPLTPDHIKVNMEILEWIKQFN